MGILINYVVNKVTNKGSRRWVLSNYQDEDNLTVYYRKFLIMNIHYVTLEYQLACQRLLS